MGNLLTKAGRGMKIGDAANIAVRNILTSISEAMDTKITEDGMREALDFFDWRCPYTGRYLGKDPKSKGAVLDHIVPQNKDECGLNVKGNLIYVDRVANLAKAGKKLEDFLMNNDTVDGLKGVSKAIRLERLEKIREFQRINQYNPIEIKNRLSKYMLSCYSAVQEAQREFAKSAICQLKNAIPELFSETCLSKLSREDSNQLSVKVPDDSKSQKSGTIVKEQLIPLLETGGASIEEIDDFLTIDGSKRAFGLSGFALLSEKVNEDTHCRYYKTPIVIRGKQYFICSQWYERNRPKLVAWIQTHKIL